MILELSYVIRYRMNNHDMYILLHAKQEMVSSEMLFNLGAQSWARASGEGERDEKYGLKSLASCRSQERYNNEGIVPMGRDQASHREGEQQEWAAPRSPQLHDGNRALSSHQCD